MFLGKKDVWPPYFGGQSSFVGGDGQLSHIFETPFMAVEKMGECCRKAYKALWPNFLANVPCVKWFGLFQDYINLSVQRQGFVLIGLPVKAVCFAQVLTSFRFAKRG